MRNKAFFIAILSALLLFSILNNDVTHTYAEKTWGKKYTDDPSKVWTVTFSDPLHEKVVESDAISIIDKNGRTVATKVTVSDDKKSASIAPEKPYVFGMEYTLIIKKSIRSKENQNLEERIAMPFEIRKSKGAKDSEEKKASPSSLKISVDQKEYLSMITVVADASVKKITVDGREMQYDGNHTFELALAGVDKGDILRVKAIGFNGRTAYTENYKVD